MAKDGMTFTFKCRKCGTLATWPANPRDSDRLSCKACGEDHGTYGALKKATMKLAEQEAVKMAKKAFKGLR